MCSFIEKASQLPQSKLYNTPHIPVDERTASGYGIEGLVIVYPEVLFEMR